MAAAQQMCRLPLLCGRVEERLTSSTLCGPWLSILQAMQSTSENPSTCTHSSLLSMGSPE